MGLFDRLRGIKNPVDATYRLVASSYPTGNAVYENCAMDGVVEAPGIPPTAVHHVSIITPVAKWPQPGQVLPVTVDRADPTRLKIRWDDVPSASDTARMLAAQAAAQAQQGRAFTPPPPYGAPPPPGAPPAHGAQAMAVAAAPGRPLPGTPGGGLTPEETQQIVQGGAAALGLVPMTGRVIAVHQAAMPPGVPEPPGGIWDLTLDVAPPAGGGFTTVTRVAFGTPARRAEIAAAGRELPLVVDPSRIDRVAIDTTRLPSNP